MKINKETKKVANKEIASHDIKVLKFRTFQNEGKDDTISVDLSINGVIINGCRIVEGKNGDFVSFPSRKGKDGKYYNYAYVALSEEDITNIENQIQELNK